MKYFIFPISHSGLVRGAAIRSTFALAETARALFAKAPLLLDNRSTMSLSQHEINYTPSRWSKRYRPEEVEDQFLKFCETITEKARKTTKCELNVPYGNTERTKYDVYGTDLPPDAPVLVFIHGGYWQEFSKDFAGFSVPAFVANGIRVINIGYDLCPNVRIGVIISQIQNATEQILKNALNSQCRRVWVVGHSAGGHLAASLIEDRSWTEKMVKEGYFHLLKGFMLIGGIYDLKPLLTTSFNEKLTLTESEIGIYSFSKVKSVHKPIQGLKIIVAVGECDSPVFINESRDYAQKAVTLVDDVRYVLIRKNTDHFDIVEHLVDPDYILTKLLLRSLSAEE